jgi:hypothetical protein
MIVIGIVALIASLSSANIAFLAGLGAICAIGRFLLDCYRSSQAQRPPTIATARMPQNKI